MYSTVPCKRTKTNKSRPTGRPGNITVISVRPLKHSGTANHSREKNAAEKERALTFLVGFYLVLYAMYSVVRFGSVLFTVNKCNSFSSHCGGNSESELFCQMC